VPRRVATGWWVLLALVVAWAVGGALLLAGRRTSAEAQRVRDAPACSAAETLTAAPCQSRLSGTVVSFTHEEVEVDVDGQRLTMRIMVSGEITDQIGTPVQVTLYGGQPIHVEGVGLSVDARGSPATHAFNYFGVGFAIIFISTFLIGVNALAAWIAGVYRRRAGAS
jgi:hypothetical protein